MTQARKKSTAGRNIKIANALHGCLKAALSPLGTFRRDTMLSIMAETIVPVAQVSSSGGKAMKFWGFGGWPLYRGRSVLEKEPLTIRWIDGFAPDSVFWDIGANIGAFSIYAAVARNIQTYAFEPSAANMAVLCKNIELNRADTLIAAFPIAFSNETKIDNLNMISTAAGNTGGQFSHKETRETNTFRQSCLGFSIDDFVQTYKIPVPEHIKIDVDGIESFILKGAQKTLQNKKVKTILLEADKTAQDYVEIRAILEPLGFVQKEQEPTVRGRDHICNFIFSR